MYKDSLTPEDVDDLKVLLSMPGFKHFLGLLDDRIETIKGNVLSVSLDKDPAKAQLQLYVERMKYEGAVAVRTALLEQVKAIKEKR